MTIDDQIKDEKLQYNINRKVAEISALLSGKINKHEYPAGEEMLPFNQKQTIEHAKFTYYPLGKAFKKQIQITKDQEEYQKKQLKNKKKTSQSNLI